MSDDAATVSVIIPTYNRAHSIAEAIDSVLAQTVPAHEIIVVDDGSADETPAILAAYGDRIIVIRQENGGVSAARNAGIARATGEWIGFLDSDDLWLPERLAIFARDSAAQTEPFVVHYANLRLVGAGYNWDMFAIRGLAFPPDRAMAVDDVFALALGGCFLPGMVVARDALVKTHGFDPTMRVCEDTLLLCEIAFSGRWLATSAIVTEARRLDGDAAALSAADRVAPVATERMRASLGDKLAKLPLSAAQARRLAGFHTTLLFRLARAERRGDPASARRTLVRAARRHPSPLKGWTKAALCLALGERGYDIATGGGDRWHRG